MNKRFVLLSLPILSCQTLLTTPLTAAGSHRGWCIGVGNPHRSSACSSTTPVTQPGEVTQTPIVNQPPQQQPLVPTPNQLPKIPKRPFENRQYQSKPVIIVSAIIAPPSQTTVINPQLPQIVPPHLQPPMPQPAQQVPIPTPNPQQPPMLQPPVAQPPVAVQGPVVMPPVQQPPVLQPVLQPPVVQPPVAVQGPVQPPPVIIKPLDPPTFSTITPPQTPVVGPGKTETIPLPNGPLVPPPLQQPPVTTTNPPITGNPPVIIKPLDPPIFTTVTRPPQLVTTGNPVTILVIPTDGPTLQGPGVPQFIKRPRQYLRPTQEVIVQPPGNLMQSQTSALLPTNLVAEGLGRHPAHQLPVFELPDGPRQCLISGFGRRYIIDADRKRQAVGMSAVLRGFGPIMRDVPAFSHRTAGCILLVKRREDKD